MNQVKCDACGYLFMPQPQEIKGYMFFKCPNCQKEYPVARITPRGLELRKKLNKERKRYEKMKPPTNTPGEIMRQYEKIQKLQEEFEKEVTRLPGKKE